MESLIPSSPFFHSFSDLPFVIRLALLLVIFTVLLLGFTYTFTSFRYASSLRKYGPTSTEKGMQIPPKIPYTIPWLGNALQFLSPPRPGQFWQKLFKTHPRDTGACTLLMGGETMHVLFDPLAVETMFRTKGLHRDDFNDKVVLKSLGMPMPELIKFYGKNGGPVDEKGRTPRARHDHFFHEYLLNPSCANELTRRFIIQIRERYELDGINSNTEFQEVRLGRWLRDHMFKASADTLFGTRLVELYPQILNDYWEYDATMLGLLFDVPKFIDPKPYNDLEKNVNGMSKWRAEVLKECNNQIPNPKTVEWEPLFGSRISRVRQLFYMERGITNRSAAAVDLGFLFGISSNSIPCLGWMFMHTLDPNGDRTILPQIMAEIATARLPEGKGFDVSKLCGLPVLQSVFAEVMRLYADLLVTRGLEHDLILPFDDGKRQMRFSKGTALMAPSWLGHHDDNVWPNADKFDHTRFLKTDPETGAQVYTTNSMMGKYFPWGGGKTICPGRVFAKQEVLASFAMAISSFEIEFARFVGDDEKENGKFPGIRPSFNGTGIVAMEGDMVVKIRKRQS